MRDCFNMLPVSDSGKYNDGIETFLDSSHSVVCTHHQCRVCVNLNQHLRNNVIYIFNEEYFSESSLST